MINFKQIIQTKLAERKNMPMIKYNTTLKTFVKTASILGCLALASQTALAADYSKAEKELRIMSKIFDTSFNESKGSSSRNYSSRSSSRTESTYLAKQGMVFTFKFSGSRFGNSSDWQAFGEGIGNLVGSISAEIAHSFSEIDLENSRAPRAPRSPFPSSNWENSDNWEQNVEAYEEFQQVMENLRDEQRDNREEVRDLQREVRDIERQARRDENHDIKELAKSKEKLEKKMKELNKHVSVYEKKMKEYREEKKQKLTQSNKNKSDLIISTLCDYGSTLRSLENGEHVTLVFSNFKNNKDQIYVFNYKDVKSCSNKDKLIKKAVSYQI